MANLSSVITQTVGNSSGGVNLITAPSSSSIWTASGLTLSTTTTTSELPLEGFSSTATKFLLTGSTTSAYVDFTVPSSLLSTKLALQWYARANVTTIGSITLTMNSYSSASNRTSNTSATAITLQTSSVASASQSFQTTFDSHGTNQYYRLTLSFPASASNWYTLAQMVVGPGTIAQGAAISEWQSFTPSTTNTWTTNATWTGKYRREGSMARIKYGIALAGAPGGTSQLGINLPTGLTIDTTAILNMARAESLAHVTYYQVNNLGKAYQAIAWGEYDSTQSTTGKMRFLAQDDSSASNHDFAAITASYPNTWGNLDYLVIEAFIPISEWAGNGTVNLGAGAQVEYASNDGSGGTSAGVVYDTGMKTGPAGSNFVAVNSTTANSITAYKVTFQYPIQVDDLLVLEVNESTTGQNAWSEHSSIVTMGRSFQGTANYGMYITPNDSTSVYVGFGNKGRVGNNASYAGDGATWGGITDRKWRVRKAKASAPVGFGLAGTDGSAGLYKAGQAPGLVTGAAIASGYVGERLSASLSNVTLTGSSSAKTVGTINLTPGVWVVYGKVFMGVAGTTMTYMDVSISTTDNTIYAPTTVRDGTSGISLTRFVAPSPLYLNVASTTPVHLVAEVGYTGTAPATTGTSCQFYAVRIA